jgi:hypothetical protein
LLKAGCEGTSGGSAATGNSVVVVVVVDVSDSVDSLYVNVMNSESYWTFSTRSPPALSPRTKD